MTHGEEKANRRWWRRRFSLRTLAIVVTLACAYFATWPATEKFASIQVDTVHLPDGRAISARDFNSNLGRDWPKEIRDKSSLTLTSDETSPAPMIIARRVQVITLKGTPKPTKKAGKRCYYIWFFGPQFKLPFESDVDGLRRFP